jgi:glutamate synthase (ferredoxin)
MSGGIAYVYDVKSTFKNKCNRNGLNLDPVEELEDINELKELIENHYNATQSTLAQRILENWEKELPKFIKVLPEEYKQALLRIEDEKKVKI